GYGMRLEECVRWIAFEVQEIDSSQQPVHVAAQITEQQTVGQWNGMCRAQSAVVEAAILVTRLHLVPIDEVLDAFTRLSIVVEKTAGPRQRLAFVELQQMLH